MTFKDYIARRKAGYDDMGDFLRLARADSSLPEVAIWPEMKAYLEAKGLSHKIIEGGERAWDFYQRSLTEASRPPRVRDRRRSPEGPRQTP